MIRKLYIYLFVLRHKIVEYRFWCSSEEASLLRLQRERGRILITALIGVLQQTDQG